MITEWLDSLPLSNQSKKGHRGLFTKEKPHSLSLPANDRPSAMSVFISWSGKNTKSHQVAEALRGWIGHVIQGCDPWVSTVDIDAGDHWGSELFAQLANHKVGIICVTKENQASPWLNFEAGALAMQMKGDRAEASWVCPLLIGMTDDDITGPMKLLQMVTLDKAGMFKISQVVNKSGEKPLKDEVLQRAFDKNWPELRDELKLSEKSDRPVEEILNEILEQVRNLNVGFLERLRQSSEPFQLLDAYTPPLPPSIDKTTKPALSDLDRFLSSTRWSAPSVYSAGLSGIAKHAAAGLALKQILVSEVQKIDIGLAQVVSDRDASYDGETPRIPLSPVVPEHRLAQVKEAADRIGIKVAFSWDYVGYEQRTNHRAA
jgi:hypothetical protein